MTRIEDEDVWRRETPHVLAALLRRYGSLEGCEDAVQEALLEASSSWPVAGVPADPRGWLIRVASRRLIDAHRRDAARVARESRAASLDQLDRPDISPPAVEHRDSSLEVLALCCHPALSVESQVALTLRAVIGLSTKQIASLYLIPAATAGQRISRAKAVIDAAERRFPRPLSPRERLAAMLQVLYLTYTTGHTDPLGERVTDVSVTAEAIRLTRQLHRELGDEPEVAGLLALMLLTEARSGARETRANDLVLLRDQDRRLWNRELIAEGTALITRTLPMGPVGAYQLQAAIAAVHDEAVGWAETDWPQIAELYRMLLRIAPSPTVTLNYAVAVAETAGPRAGLAVLAPLAGDGRMTANHRLHAVRAALLEQAGDPEAALDEYRAAARLCQSIPEQRYLNGKVLELQRGA